MSNLITDVRDPRRVEDAESLQSIQRLIDQIKFRYADSTLAFKSLDLAWEATRQAFYAVKDESKEKVDSVERSLEWVKGHDK
jgi:hypothetical protein